jgi:hypothetical protein
MHADQDLLFLRVLRVPKIPKVPKIVSNSPNESL